MKNNVKTWFVVSDIHSFYHELKVALKQAGFRKTNKTHGIIVCGDIFDRGSETLEVYNFLSSLPKHRCVLVKGNHESLYFDLLEKSYPDHHDFSNHTVDTFCQIAGKDIAEFHCGDITWEEIRSIVADSDVTKWLRSKQWVDYYELDKYIFVHSFIPLNIKREYIRALYMYASSQLASKCFEYDHNWRTASIEYWEEARWVDPIDRYKHGLFNAEAEKGKVLVVGHWHTSDFYRRISNIYEQSRPITKIWLDNNLIALDCGVFRSWYGYVHPQNVLVIDTSDFNTCYDQDGNILEPIKTAPIIETVTITGGENND